MIRIVGLDLSTKRTGIALPDGTCRSITPRSGANDPGRRLYEITSAVIPQLLATQPHLVVIEDYSFGGHQGNTMAVIAELGGVIRLELFLANFPSVRIRPTSLKAFAAHGAAEKAEMIDAARALGAVVANDDEADAWWLRAAGLQHYAPRDAWPALTPRLATLPWPPIKATADA